MTNVKYTKANCILLAVIPIVILIATFIGYYGIPITTDKKPPTAWSRTALLDAKSHFEVTWHVNSSTDFIIFEVMARTEGWIGFGISQHGGMTGSDIVVGGIDRKGKAYLQDRFAEGKKLPKLDAHQDWTLLNSSRKDGVTYLKFSRPLSTCDPEDVTIAGDTQSFIWALGTRDQLSYHGTTRRGSYAVSILNPPKPVIDLSTYKTIPLVANLTIPTAETTYWCQVIRSPPITGLNHIVAIGPNMNSTLAIRHTHHLTLYVCDFANLQKNINREEFFKDLAAWKGRQCYGGNNVTGEVHANPLPIYHYCKHGIYAWASGASTLLFPEDVGFPLENAGQEEHKYFLLELHLDNPGARKGINLETGVQIYYTDSLRPKEAGLIYLGAAFDWRLTIPPNSKSLRVAGHCSPHCTQNIEQEGYTIFNVQPHSHNSAQIRLRHFRNGTELPWIANDPTFNGKFQTNRDVPFTKLLANDQLTIQCTFDNQWMRGGVTLGGYGSREEMCAINVYYYPAGRLMGCNTYPYANRLMNLTGIHNVSNTELTDPIIIAPKEFKGMKYSKYVNTVLNWTDELKAAMQYEQADAPQQSECYIKGSNFIQTGLPSSEYPKQFTEYTGPDEKCDVEKVTIPPYIETSTIPSYFETTTNTQKRQYIN